MKANHKEEWISIQTGSGYTQVKVNPGQFLFGRKVASQELKMNLSSVRNRIQKLKNIGNVDIQPNNHFSIITIVNWDSYQSTNDEIGQAEGQAEDKQRTSRGQAEDTYKNDKNVKNEKKNLNILSDHKKFMSLYSTKFEEQFNSKPIIEWGKDGAIVKGLLTKIPFEELSELLDRFFASDDSFITKSGYTLGVFKSQINKLRIGNVEKLSVEDKWMMVKEEQDRREALINGEKGPGTIRIGYEQNKG